MPEKFYIVAEECISCGTCAEICPDCFKYEDSMEHAEVTGFDCPKDQIEEAIDSCPAACIHWGEDQG